MTLSMLDLIRFAYLATIMPDSRHQVNLVA